MGFRSWSFTGSGPAQLITHENQPRNAQAEYGQMLLGGEDPFLSGFQSHLKINLKPIKGQSLVLDVFFKTQTNGIISLNCIC